MLGDESLLKDPFKSLAAGYLGFLAARNDANTEAASVVANALPGGEALEVSLGELMYNTGHDLIGEYQRPNPDAEGYPAGLPVETAEDIARQTRFEVEAHLAEAYNDRFGSVK